MNRLAVESIHLTNPGARVTLHFENPPSNSDKQVLQSKVEFRAGQPPIPYTQSPKP
ncbi:MAG: hypothetical protein M3Y08_12865 [Fibrobacterota bacterium]|nr:hypothetical protein [Fibrobacterota bacterium]